MSRKTYLKPAGIFSCVAGGGDASLGNISAPLAGREDLRFMGIESLAHERGETLRRLSPVAELAGIVELSGDALLQQDFARLIAPRSEFAGLPMDRPHIMGIVNVTPDSFSDGGQHASTEAAITHALKLEQEGAAILDIGGESTRPGSDAVALAEELQRVIAVIAGLRKRTSAKISIDTRKAEVMRQAAEAGADIINDVSALSHDPDALRVAAETGLPVILMHAQGDPKTMNDNPQYRDVVLDVLDYLEQRIAECEAAGIPREKLAADPGIGFGKHLHHNVAVMAGLALYQGLGVPLLLGASRKKMIGQLCDVADAKDRLPGSLACAIAGVAAGYQMIRVHDVSETRQALSVWQASMRGSETGMV